MSQNYILFDDDLHVAAEQAALGDKEGRREGSTTAQRQAREESSRRAPSPDNKHALVPKPLPTAQLVSGRRARSTGRAARVEGSSFDEEANSEGEGCSEGEGNPHLKHGKQGGQQGGQVGGQVCRHCKATWTSKRWSKHPNSRKPHCRACHEYLQTYGIPRPSKLFITSGSGGGAAGLGRGAAGRKQAPPLLPHSSQPAKRGGGSRARVYGWPAMRMLNGRLGSGGVGVQEQCFRKQIGGNMLCHMLVRHIALPHACLFKMRSLVLVSSATGWGDSIYAIHVCCSVVAVCALFRLAGDDRWHVAPSYGRG